MTIINNHKDKVYTYEYDGHPVCKDEKGNYYCRAANAVLTENQRFCWCCPLLGEAQKDNSVCWYYDVNPREQLCGYAEKVRTDGLINARISPEFPDYVKDGESFNAHFIESAFQFAAHWHKGDVRKGTNIPYISHLIETADIVKTLTNDAKVIAAAVLHDVLEDTKCTLAELEGEFGSTVSDLVSYETEDKRAHLPAADTWRLRKQEFIDHLGGSPIEAKMITLGDKLSNMRAIKRDYDAIGEQLWERFNQKNKNAHGWYHHCVCEQLKELSHTSAWQEYDELVHDVFGKFNGSCCKEGDHSGNSL